MARTQFELAENSFDVRLDRLLANDELLRDLPIGLAAGQQPGNLPLARGKRIERRWTLNLRRPRQRLTRVAQRIRDSQRSAFGVKVRVIVWRELGLCRRFRFLGHARVGWPRAHTDGSHQSIASPKEPRCRRWPTETKNAHAHARQTFGDST